SCAPLYSFPTRRSSDLITTTEEVCVRYWPWWLGGGCRDYNTVTTTITTETVDSEYTFPINAQGGDIITISLIGDGGTLCSLAVEDRKSTRLNSSHVKTS